MIIKPVILTVILIVGDGVDSYYEINSYISLNIFTRLQCETMIKRAIKYYEHIGATIVRLDCTEKGKL